MQEKYQKIINEFSVERVKRDEPLSLHTTFKIGGPADLYFEAETEDEIMKTLGLVKELNVDYLVLGGGSNLLVGDKGFRGMVIKVQSTKYRVQRIDSRVNVYAEAGVMVGSLLNELVNKSAAGLEFMAGIPGTVGGSVAGNAGAWQRSLSETVLRVKVITPQGKVKWLNKDECEFDYRNSRFKGGKEVILEVELQLNIGNQEEIKKQIAENLEKRSCQPKEPSAGSIFINPKPSSAGALIEQCGLKGATVGGAQISDKHANFIVNLGSAKALDVVSLIDLAKAKVKEKFNIELKEEILRIGEF